MVWGEKNIEERGVKKEKFNTPKQPNLIKLLWTVSIHLMHTDHERMANLEMWRPLKNGGTLKVYCYKKLSFFCKNAHKDNLTVCYAREKLIMWHNPVKWLCNCGERNWQSQTKLYSLVCLHSEEKCNFNQHFRSKVFVFLWKFVVQIAKYKNCAENLFDIISGEWIFYLMQSVETCCYIIT